MNIEIEFQDLWSSYVTLAKNNYIKPENELDKTKGISRHTNKRKIKKRKVLKNFGKII